MKYCHFQNASVDNILSELEQQNVEYKEANENLNRDVIRLIRDNKKLELRVASLEGSVSKFENVCVFSLFFSLHILLISQFPG